MAFHSQSQSALRMIHASSLGHASIWAAGEEIAMLEWLPEQGSWRIQPKAPEDGWFTKDLLVSQGVAAPRLRTHSDAWI